MSELSDKTIARAQGCDVVFAKFLSANDTGLTGGHQCGIYIQKKCVPLIFDCLFEKGQNHKRSAEIVWNEELSTVSSFTYYGTGTRNEYRITRFGRGFDLLKPNHTGDLVVICRESAERYYAYVLSHDDEIEAFLDAFSLSPTGTNGLVKGGWVEQDPADRLAEYVEAFVETLDGDFPDTRTMALTAEEAQRCADGDLALMDADQQIIRWMDVEYDLFRRVEDVHYSYITLEPLASVEEAVAIGLEITNRRKARAGKSLEHHLATLFAERGLSFTPQAKTEGNKKPDFIFPSEEAYKDPSFPAEKLVFLGSKRTCKDRWRQVINEADRIPCKYLFTLQQGVTESQMDEMRAENVVLVVPKEYHSSFPPSTLDNVITLEEFIGVVQKSQQQ